MMMFCLSEQNILYFKCSMHVHICPECIHLQMFLVFYLAENVIIVDVKVSAFHTVNMMILINVNKYYDVCLVIWQCNVLFHVSKQ